MATLEVSVTIDATPPDVWSDLSDVSSHVEWMGDAVAIRFLTPQTHGIGTTFDCDTKIGPLTTVDRMEITSWVPNEEMGVRHSGAVTGEGAIRLSPVGIDRTQMSWIETLDFPMRLGGAVGERIAKPIMEWMWRRSLRAFARRFSGADNS